uniref:Artemin a n=1 Tax=Sinocyclocheilus rhinocerous TaxID=307959 RepID=A0A673JD73_9TELE
LIINKSLNGKLIYSAFRCCINLNFIKIDPYGLVLCSSSRKSTRNRKERRNRKRGRSSQDCRLERKEMKVRDLGLGYDSDEIVVFKYCVGTCMSARKNYDLALKVLTDNGSISGRKVSTHPCCRPTRFETVSFMDAQTSWQTIKWLSAANCSCVG